MAGKQQVRTESAGPYELFALAVVAPLIFPLSVAFAAVSYALMRQKALAACVAFIGGFLV